MVKFCSVRIDDDSVAERFEKRLLDEKLSKQDFFLNSIKDFIEEK